MLMRRSVALENRSPTIPPIDSDQKVALLHHLSRVLPFFGSELANLQKAKDPASSLTVYPAPWQAMAGFQEGWLLLY